MSEAKDAYGTQSLAHCYRTGEGRKKDLLKAEQLLSQAADSGRIEARHDLAAFYVFTLNDPTKYQRAINILDETLETDHKKSYFVMGAIVKNGFGLNENLNLAKEYFLHAALNGHDLSILVQMTGYCYGSLGFIVDPKECEKWSKLLVENKNFQSKEDIKSYIKLMMTSKILKQYIYSPQDIFLITSAVK
jgi:TPR repeat protein